MHRYETEKLENSLQAMQRDLAKQKDHFENNYIPQESLQEFRQSLETKVLWDLSWGVSNPCQLVQSSYKFL